MTPLILNIETSTEVCSLGISRGNEMLVVKNAPEQYGHASWITRLIEECLKEAGLSLKNIDAVAISKGPGSYTGLRIGAATAKGICYSLDKPLIGVSTLQSLAWGTWQKEKFEGLYCPMIDARRMEVYLAVFNAANDEVSPVQAVVLEENSLEVFLAEGKKIVCSGNGAEKSKSVLKHNNILFSDVICSAAHLSVLANKAFANQQFEDVAYFSPFYFKSPNITTPKKVL